MLKTERKIVLCDALDILLHPPVRMEQDVYEGVSEPIRDAFFRISRTHSSEEEKSMLWYYAT